MLSGLSLSAMVMSVSDVHPLSAFTSIYSIAAGSVRLLRLGQLSTAAPVRNSKFSGIVNAVTIAPLAS